MSHLINPFPDLCLSPEEKRVVGHYPSAERPGVLDRRYTYTLTQSAIPGEISKPTTRFIPSGRRCKLYAITFSGDIEAWSIKLLLASGEQMIEGSARVAALLNSASMLNTAAQPDFTQSEVLLQRTTFQPFTFDPPVVFEGAKSLTVEGTCLADLKDDNRSILNMCFWVWEFPVSQVRFAPRGV